MSVMSFERSDAGRSEAWQAVAEMVGRFVAELRRQHKVRRDRHHLMQLPDYLLRDIGISRLEIDRINSRDDRPRFVVFPDIAWRRRP
jgi:uncharacterized protein YjiS (DUF1127 family)